MGWPRGAPRQRGAPCHGTNGTMVNPAQRRWRIGLADAFHPKGHGFDSRSSRHLGTLGKSFTHSCMWCFGVKFQHSIRAMKGALLSRSGLEEAL